MKESASGWFLLRKYITMHRPCTVKFITAQQAKQVYKCKNIKEKLCKCNAEIWYKKSCRHKQLTLSHISIKINSNNPQERKGIWLVLITQLYHDARSM